MAAGSPTAKLPGRRSSRGYILITLMLFLTLLAITAVAVLPEIAQQIKRDREEEMIHRAVGYSRAIRKYYKKFGRYPTRVEDLENTNNMRFLRKRYKDPVTGKDFKLLRMGDPALALGGFGQTLGQGGGLQAPGQGANLVGAPGGGVRAAGPGDANTPRATGLPGPPQPTGTTDPASGDAGTGTGTGATTGTTKTSDPASGDDGNGSSSSSSSPSSSSAAGPGLGGQVFGGGPILGVMSSSKDKTVREFSKKSHYNEWLFIYDPTNDRGGLLNAPTQPNMGQGFTGSPGQNLIPGGGNSTPGATPRIPGPQPGPGQQPPEE